MMFLLLPVVWLGFLVLFTYTALMLLGGQKIDPKSPLAIPMYVIGVFLVVGARFLNLLFPKAPRQQPPRPNPPQPPVPVEPA